MGCYDTVIVPCPVCGTKAYFQSKSGPCRLDTFELDDAPAEVLMDVNRHAPYACKSCGTNFEVKVKFAAIAIPVEWVPPEDD